MSRAFNKAEKSLIVLGFCVGLTSQMGFSILQTMFAMDSGTGKSFCVENLYSSLNRAMLTKCRSGRVQSPSSELCEAFARSLKTGWILSVICVK